MATLGLDFLISSAGPAPPPAGPPPRSWFTLLRRASTPVFRPDAPPSPPTLVPDLPISAEPTPLSSPPLALVPLEDDLDAEDEESPEQRTERKKWSRAKRRMHAFANEAVAGRAGECDEWQLRIVRDGGPSSPSIIEMTPLQGNPHHFRLPPRSADGTQMHNNGGTWQIRDHNLSPTGSVTKSSWRVDGLPGFPSGVFVEFRKKERKSTEGTGDKENSGLKVESTGGSWFAARSRTSTGSRGSGKEGEGDGTAE